MPLLSDDALFKLRSVERSARTTSLLRQRNWDTLISGMPQAGNHWLRYMLGLTIARLHDLPPPEHLESVDYIYMFRRPRQEIPGLPRIAWSHALPNYLHRLPIVVEGLKLPNYVVVVRSIVDSLVSSYEKAPEKYDHDFSAFLRGRHARRYLMVGSWRRIMFCNAWGPVVERFPDRTCVVRYEDLRADTVEELARLCGFLGLADVGHDLLTDVVTQSSKTRMTTLAKSAESAGAITLKKRRALDWFSPEDAAYLDGMMRKHLRYAFGYDYGSLTERASARSAVA